MKEHEILDRIQYWKCLDSQHEPYFKEGEIYWVLINDPTNYTVLIRDQKMINFQESTEFYPLPLNGYFNMYDSRILKHFTRIL